jgi:methionyl-tRNA formyltransferase
LFCATQEITGKVPLGILPGRWQPAAEALVKLLNFSNKELQMKIIYMGTPALCLPVLEGLQAGGHHVVLAVSQPDRPRGRGQKPAPPPVKCRADELGIPCIQPDSLKDQNFHSKIAEQKADILVVVAFSLLPESLFPLVKYGAVNLHASLLPKYRGAAPIPWAIANGEN